MSELGPYLDKLTAQMERLVSETGETDLNAIRAAFYEKLTAHDRCDVADCGAQAYVLVRWPSGALLFCGHHFALNESGIMAHAVSISDQRELIGGNRLDVSA